jgi:hypothetical protein
MTNEHDNTGSDPQARDDYKAVMRHITEGSPSNRNSRRVRERAERITDEIRREHGDIEVVKLLHDAREDR